MSTQRTRSRAAAGGRREAQVAIRREQLLAAALTLFSEHGYAATSTKRIAEAAGVTEGLVFHYFGSKEALLLELASQQSMFAGRVLSLASAAGTTTARALLVAIADGLSAVSEREAAFVAFLSAEAQINPLLRAPIVAGTRVVLDRLVGLLAPHVASGELRADVSLRAVLEGFFGGFAFFSAQRRGVSPAVWRRESAAFAAEWAAICWRGIANPELLSDDSVKPKRRRRV